MGRGNSKQIGEYNDKYKKNLLENIQETINRGTTPVDSITQIITWKINNFRNIIDEYFIIHITAIAIVISIKKVSWPYDQETKIPRYHSI